MFEVPHLNEESLQEYDELELCYMETGVVYRCHVFNDFLPHVIFFLLYPIQSTRQENKRSLEE